MKTCVLPFSRRKGFEWRMRSRSRWNGVRRRQSSSSRRRPRVSYERTASGESQRSSCSRTWLAKASATVPATFGIELRLDDDRDGPSVRAPGGTCHVRGTLRAQKTDDGRDLRRLREAAEWPSRPDRLQDLFARLGGVRRLLVGEAAFAEPCVRRGRSGCDGIAANAVLRIKIGDEPRH